MQKRIVSLWISRLPSERVLRICPVDAPFALTLHQGNTERIYCLNAQAEKAGLHRGMGFADARAFCRELQSRPADLKADRQFLHMLARWAKRYCPWVGFEGSDGLVMNITGSAHLFGGEMAMLGDIRLRLARSGINARFGLADTPGAAWALAHFSEGVASSGNIRAQLAPLPVAALRLEDKTCIALQRLGVRSIADLIALPRATVTRRFGPDVVLRLDQALGEQSENISPLSEMPHFGVRITLPEPIGLSADVLAGTERLLERLCAKLKAQEMGARVMQLTMRRVDQAHQQVELRLARPMRDTTRILPLFEQGVAQVDSGYGIDQMRLEATQVEPLPARQVSHTRTTDDEGLDDLITRLGTRVELDNVQLLLPADSHIPEHSFIISPAAYCDPSESWVALHPRPLRLFPPEAINGSGPRPPSGFRWRRMSFATGRSTGPERIAPEWWLDDENWRFGVRDYWNVDTKQGRQLWLFYTPQNSGWFVQGEFA